ncbi:MAG: REP-associated tyrosine transposase [Arenimonas sp.]
MVNYRRVQQLGGTFFFTLTLRDRSSALLTEHIDVLRRTFADVQAIKPFKMDAIVIMPDHLHCIWTLPDKDTDYSGRWRSIKSLHIRLLRKAGVDVKTNAKGEAGIWQRRFWEHTIRDEKDLEAHINYIHINPVKHGLVENVIDWPWSSFHAYVRKGLLTKDWASNTNAKGKFGE